MVAWDAPATWSVALFAATRWGDLPSSLEGVTGSMAADCIDVAKRIDGLAVFPIVSTRARRPDHK